MSLARWPAERPFTIADGGRTIVYGPGAAADAPETLAAHGFVAFALATTARAAAVAPAVAERAAVIVEVPPGPVPTAAAAIADAVGDRPVVALGGGRVVDAAKAVGSAHGLSVATIATTLAGAELTPHHRPLPGAEDSPRVRPALVIADPDLMASAPAPLLAGSAMNALAHALEALYTPAANPIAEALALGAADAIGDGLRAGEAGRREVGLGGLLAGIALGAAGFAVHHVLCQSIVRTAGTPHAATNAVVLPHVVDAMAGRAPREVAAFRAAAGDVAALAALAGPATLEDLGVTAGRLPAIADAALGRAELAATPGPPVTAAELLAILRAAHAGAAPGGAR